MLCGRAGSEVRPSGVVSIWLSFLAATILTIATCAFMLVLNLRPWRIQSEKSYRDILTVVGLVIVGSRLFLLYAFGQVVQYELCVRAFAGKATAKVWWQIGQSLHSPLKLSEVRSWLKIACVLLIIFAGVGYKQAIAFQQLRQIEEPAAGLAGPLCGDWFSCYPADGFNTPIFYNSTALVYLQQGNGTLAAPYAACSVDGDTSFCIRTGINFTNITSHYSGQPIGFTASFTFMASGAATCWVPTQQEYDRAQSRLYEDLEDPLPVVDSSSFYIDSNREFFDDKSTMNVIWVADIPGGGANQGLKCNCTTAFISGQLSGEYGPNGWQLFLKVTGVPVTNITAGDTDTNSQSGLSLVWDGSRVEPLQRLHDGMTVLAVKHRLALVLGYKLPVELPSDAATDEGVFADIQTMVALSRFSTLNLVNLYTQYYHGRPARPDLTFTSYTILYNSAGITSRAWLAATLASLLLPWLLALCWMLHVFARWGWAQRYYELTPLSVAAMCAVPDSDMDQALAGSAQGGKPRDPGALVSLEAALPEAGRGGGRIKMVHGPSAKLYTSPQSADPM